MSNKNQARLLAEKLRNVRVAAQHEVRAEMDRSCARPSFLPDHARTLVCVSETARG